MIVSQGAGNLRPAGITAQSQHHRYTAELDSITRAKSGDMCGVRVLFTQIARTLNWQLYLKLETEILCTNV